MKKNLLDIDKWRMKFKYLFDREKILQFDLNPETNLFSKKGVVTNLEPKALKPLGQHLLQTSGHFWVLFTNYVSVKVQNCIDNKEKVRR